MEEAVELIFGSDHAGFILKEELKNFMKQDESHQIYDEGCFSEDRCNYPLFSQKVVQRVLTGAGRGILVCGSGIGVDMVANRFKGIRAALVRSIEEAKLSRQHNDANILCLGSRITSSDLCKEIISAWLAEPFEGGRHSERVAMFSNIGADPSIEL